MEVSLIVAVADNGVIGNQGAIPWRQKADMQFFRQTTSGHPIIMGRATFESFKNGPLPNRHNIVITRNADYTAPGATVVHSIEQALQVAKDADEVFIIGGGAIYEQSLPLATKLYVTRIHAEPEGDTFFAFDPKEWELVSSAQHQADADNQYNYTFQTYRRR